MLLNTFFGGPCIYGLCVDSQCIVLCDLLMRSMPQVNKYWLQILIHGLKYFIQ